MIITLIVALGLPLGLAVYLLVQIIKDPNKVDKYISLVTRPIFIVTNWWSKTYIGSEVSYQVTEFFNRHVIKNIANQRNVKIEVHWVLDDKDPILDEDNTIIVCLKKDKDQTRNILKAAEISIPIITYSNLRLNVKAYLASSIDLVSLRNLASKLGNHGKYAFKKYFLDPRLIEDERIPGLYQKLVEVDNRGYFVPIFLNELEYVGDGLFAEGDTSDYTNEIVGFMEYLIQIARIEVGDDVKQWSYFTKLFNAGIILLANNERMITQGTKPYLDRITKQLKQGHESIYIISEENSWDFLIRFEKALSENDRVLIKGHYQIDGIIENNPKHKSRVKIVLLRRIDIYVDDLFKEKIMASEIEVGKSTIGEVIDVNEENAIVSVMGIDAFIKKNECSWYKIKSCKEVLNVGDTLDFEVKDINLEKLSVELTLRTSNNSLWDNLPRLNVGEETSVRILYKNGVDYISRDAVGHEIIIPIKELSWFGTTDVEQASFIDKEQKIKIIDVNVDNKEYIGSIRHLEKDPWPEINKRIRPGSVFIGKVTEVNTNFVRVDIGHGLNGLIPRERLFEAGGIYTDFSNNMVIGQGIEVIVTRVFIPKRKIHLNLKTR